MKIITIFTIIFYTSLTINGQKIVSSLFTNNYLLPEVSIEGNLDTAKYLWNILKKNRKLIYKDTVLFYEFTYQNKIFLTEKYESFNGTIKIIVKNNKMNSFLCDGKYSKSKKFNVDEKYIIKTPFFINSIPNKKLKKFEKELKKSKFIYNKEKNYFKTFYTDNNSSYFYEYRFKGQLLYKYINKVSFNKEIIEVQKNIPAKILPLILYFFNYNFNYFHENKHLILENGETTFVYNKKKNNNKIIVERNIKLNIIPNVNKCKNIKIKSETPKSLNKLLLKHN